MGPSTDVGTHVECHQGFTPAGPTHNTVQNQQLSVDGKIIGPIQTGCIGYETSEANEIASSQECPHRFDNRFFAGIGETTRQRWFRSILPSGFSHLVHHTSRLY